jgi:hypothetical protein
MEEAIERMIDILDRLAGDPDMEDDDPDHGIEDLPHDEEREEPSLGATHDVDQDRAWKPPAGLLTCGDVDLEFEGESSPECDREPSLGSLNGRGYQELWAYGSTDDREEEANDGPVDGSASARAMGLQACDSDFEPSLGWTVEGLFAGTLDLEEERR